MPRTRAAELRVETIEADRWSLHDQSPKSFTMIVFYRGLHCPVCKRYLLGLDRRLDDFHEHGVEVIAISGDTRVRAEQAKQDWELENLRIGYGQSIDSMREWGLFISHAIKESEPDLFGEPGLFLIRPDGTVYYEAINSMPFGRPSFQEMLGAVEWVLQNNYPARGEVPGTGTEAERSYAHQEG